VSDPRDPADLDRVADQLHDALHHDPPLPVSADPGLVDELGRRSAARRRGKIAALSLAAVCVVVAGGVALAATRSDTGSTHLAAGGDEASTTTYTGCVQCIQSPLTTATTVEGSGSTSSTGLTSPTSFPVTTVPTGPSTTPTSGTPTTMTGTDCGSWGPVGWPTTFVYSPMAAQCLLGGFALGKPYTFHLVIPDTDYPDHQITEDFQVVGVRFVQVRVDRTHALDAPHTVMTERCRQLTYQQGSGEVYAVGRCTPVG
jgi:hypothetical protein